MSKSFSLNTLTEGITDRNNSAEGQRLVEKWTRTGLLRGLEGVKRDNMARLLENQAAQVLRESNSLSTGGGNLASSGDLRGFTSIAFPIVRRVFGGLVANELVSIQPMSLPSGLLFYLDYTYGTNVGGDSSITDGVGNSSYAQTYTAGQSIYNLPTGRGIQSGSLATGGQYDLVGTTYSKVHKTASLTLLASGAFHTAAGANSSTIVEGVAAHVTGNDGKLLQFDPQITNLIENNTGGAGAAAGNGAFSFLVVDLSTGFGAFDTTQAKDFSIYADSTNLSLTGLGTIGNTIQGGTNVLNVRRLNQLGTYSGGVFTPNPLATVSTTGAAMLCVVSGVVAATASPSKFLTASFAIADTFDTPGASGDTLVIPSFASQPRDRHQDRVHCGYRFDP
jgi:hypothetical protein